MQYQSLYLRQTFSEGRKKDRGILSAHFIRGEKSTGVCSITPFCNIRSSVIEIENKIKSIYRQFFHPSLLTGWGI
jgi:hypothetical protein